MSAAAPYNIDGLPSDLITDGPFGQRKLKVDGLTASDLAAEGLSKEATQGGVLAALINRYGGGKLAATATLTNATQTDLVVPASGNALRVYWVSAINRTPDVSFPAVTIRLGPVELYKASAISHWEKFVGAADQSISAQLSGSGTVDLTIHYEEFTP